MWYLKLLLIGYKEKSLGIFQGFFSGASAELCQGVRLDQFTCLIGYSIQYESMTGSSFISYGTNIESPSHQDFRSSVINPS